MNPRCAGGMTLIEVMIVLLLIGLTSTFLAVTVGAERNPDTDLDRLVLALERATERARIRGTPIRFELLPQGYRFSRLDISGSWLPIGDDPLLTERNLPPDMTLRRLTLEGQILTGGVVFGGDAVLYTLDVVLPSGPISLIGQPSGVLRRVATAVAA